MIKRIWAYFMRPYPQLDMPWWKETLFTCGVVFLLFAIYERYLNDPCNTAPEELLTETGIAVE